MKLFFLSSVYPLISSVFSVCCIGVLSMFSLGGENILGLIIATIVTYWFNIVPIIKSLMIIIKCRGQ